MKTLFTDDWRLILDWKIKAATQWRQGELLALTDFVAPSPEGRNVYSIMIGLIF